MKLKTCVVMLGTLVSGSALAEPIQWSGNGHWYEYINDQVTVREAFMLAQDSVFNGMNGYLATITSADENLFASIVVADSQLAWLGGSDYDNEGVWTWINGPENGQAFNLTYENWATGEPNNCCGGENFVHTNWGMPGSWNDHGAPAWPGQTNGYIIEYSPVPVPSAAPLMLSGLALLGWRRRRA